MRHFYRSCRTFPCGFRHFFYAAGTPYAAGAAYSEDAAQAESAARPQRWQSSRHRHGHRGGSFGARRPLRYLSYRLDLDEQQQRTLAAILERLKLDREQAKLDEQKTVAAMADLVTSDTISVDGFQQALAPRTESARNLQAAVAKAMQELADMLDPDQREEFAHLLRSGAFKL